LISENYQKIYGLIFVEGKNSGFPSKMITFAVL